MKGLVMSIALLGRGRLAFPWLSWAVLGLGVATLAVNFALHDALFHRGRVETAVAATAGPGPSASTTLTLTDAKWEAAALATGPARLEALPAELGVPGMIEANLEHRVEVRPRAAGVVRESKALLGQKVKKGDVLAVLDSPDVGTARLDLRARQREMATARLEARFKEEVAANVAALVPVLRKHAEPTEIEREYADRALGAFRASLLGAYAKYELARHEEEKTLGLFKRQIVGEHPAVVATHAREGAQAEFESAVEQARYGANQEGLLAAQRARQAEAAVIDAAQRLRILGVAEDLPALLADAEDASAVPPPEDEDVTAYAIIAPFDGVLITKGAVPSQKVEVNDVLFTLADLSTVWVMANVPESEFGALPALKGGTVRFEAVAYPGRSFEAKVLSVGATVDPTTRRVAMLAEAPNPDGLFKLGMFVRITLDAAPGGESLTVPASAVVEIDGREGAFVPEGDDGRSFRFLPLPFGREAAGRRVVDRGLKPGDPVVSEGAFLLKSELVLQNETDEE